MSNDHWRLAVDIGGTFTDVVLLNDTTGEVSVEKTLTTPKAPLEAVRKGIKDLLSTTGVEPQDITAPIVHATTLITNALIEGKTGRAALVTTSGFGDTLLIRDEHRYDMYDLQIEFPEPPIPRNMTFEISERTNANGEVVNHPLDTDLEKLIDEIRNAGAESVAVCLINSYINSENEKLIASRLSESLDIPVCISAEIAPQIREYPRMITAACNAATMPLIGPYLDELQNWLKEEGFGGSVLMMLSNGGVVSAEDAAQAPIRLVESGPAAGALAARWFAKGLDEDRLLAFDMGGTTAKATLIDGFEPELTNTFEVARIYRFKKGSGFPVSVPSVDLVEIGAGGGSLAKADQFGLLKVGPESAGAEPGPASYGQGGEVAAVTDADVLLGMLDPESFLGGDMPLDASRAKDAVSVISQQLDLSDAEVAAGIHEVVNQNMSAAARMHGVERGIDLRGITLLAFGGAGPVHACGVAELLESSKVIFPVDASVLSAFGTLVSPVRIDLARSKPMLLNQIDENLRDSLLEELRVEGRRVLTAAGVEEGSVNFKYGIDARYEGQGNEITVWVGEGESWTADSDIVTSMFEEEYRRIYGLAIPDVGIEVVTWRLSASADLVLMEPGKHSKGVDEEATSEGTRSVIFNRGEEPVEASIYKRKSLKPGMFFKGPAIVEERETTSVIRPGWNVEVGDNGSLVAIKD